MANAMQGSKARRQYEDLIGVAVSDGLENIKFRNGNASFLRNGFVMSQLDGGGTRIMENNKKLHPNKHSKKVS